MKWDLNKVTENLENWRKNGAVVHLKRLEDGGGGDEWRLRKEGDAGENG